MLSRTLIAVALGSAMLMVHPAYAQNSRGAIAQAGASSQPQAPLPATRAASPQAPLAAGPVASTRQARGIGRPLLYWSLGGAAIITAVILMVEDDQSTTTTATTGTN